MKLFGIQKFLAISAFLFFITISSFALPLNASAQVSNLANPDDAEANFILDKATGFGLAAMYDLWCSITEFAEGGGFECQTHRQAYITSLINDLIFDTVTLFAWDKATGDVFTENGQPPFTFNEMFAATTQDVEAYNQIIEHGRIPHGYTALATSTYAYIQTEAPVPTDLALFLNDSVSDTMLGTPAFAANPVEMNYKVLVLGAWKITRNLALTLLGLILAIVGLMIIFRSKIAPQVTVSIYNVLPTLPIAIALIVLSYPLISLAGSAIVPLIGWASQIGFQLVKDVLPGDAGAVITTDNALAVTVAAALLSVYEIFVAVGKTSTIGLMFFMIALLLAVSLGTFYFLWNLGQIFLSFLTTTIVAPLVMVMSILPGKQGLIMNMLKRIAVDVLSLPGMVLGAYIAFAIIAYTPLNADTSWTLPGFLTSEANPFIAIPLIIKGFVGVGFIFKLGKIRKALESNFGVSGLFGGGGDAAKGPPRK